MTLTGMAPKFEKRIKGFQGKAHSPTTFIFFKDGSRLKFDMGTNPNPQSIGGKGTDADKFASNVKSFAIKTNPNGFEFIFTDGSKLSCDLSEVPTTTTLILNKP